MLARFLVGCLFASREREPSGNHEFDQLCRELGREHRLTKPTTPKTKGRVDFKNGREDMEQTLLRYVAF